MASRLALVKLQSICVQAGPPAGSQAMTLDLLYERLLKDQRRLAKDAQQSQQAGLRALREEARSDLRRLEDKLEAQVI